ncbi:MAG: PAS domain S-box protein [Hyphomicrobiales bacterium]
MRNAAFLILAVLATPSGTVPAQLAPTGDAHGATAIHLTADEREWLARHREIRLGVDIARPPFEYVDEKGNYTGISAEFIEAAAKRLGIAVVPLTGIKWTDAMEKVKVGDIDVIPKVTPSAAREKFLIFTKPYTTYPSVIVTRKDRLAGGLDDLRGLKVGVNKGQIIESNLERDHPELSLVPYPDVKAGLRALATGQCDAFIDNLGAVAYTIDTVGLPNLRIAASTPYTHDLAIGVRKDWPLLASALDKALDSIPDLEKMEIKNRWLALKYEAAINWRVVGPIGATLLAIIVFVLVWNRRLGRAIQERKRAEDDLKESEKRVQTILDTINAGIVIIDPEKRTIVDVNPVATQMIGLTRDKIIGHTCHQFICPEADDDCAVLDKDQKIDNAEQILITAAGKQIPILKTVSPVDLGGKLHLLESFVDISEQKKIEEAIRESEDRSRLLLYSVSDGIFGVDAHGRVTFINPAALAMLGFVEEDLLGKEVHSAIHHSHRDGSPYTPDVCPMYASYTRAAENHVTDEVLWRKDGSSFDVDYTSVPMRKGDAIIGAVVVFRDITKRKKAEAELKEYVADLERFNQLVIGREERMIQLKEEVNELTGKLGEEKKYKIV